MARKKKEPVHHVQMTDGKRAIIQQLFQEYDIESAEDIQDTLKDLLGGTIKEMMEAEMDDHLGYEKSQRVDRTEHPDYRNGTKRKQVNSSYGSMTSKRFIKLQMNYAQLKSGMRSQTNGLKNILMP